MINRTNTESVITGIGIVSAIGQGKEEFCTSLFNGESAFGIMQRPGRQRNTQFLGAEMAPIKFTERISSSLLRTATLSCEAALAALSEAWEEANLDEVEPQRIGLIIGGSNIQQRDLINQFDKYSERLHLLRPSYGLSFMDSDLCGYCTEQFAIKGFAHTVGGASASGQLAVIKAAEAVASGQVDVCIALGALMDISYMECQALRFMGAMGSDVFSENPKLACRPFDTRRDGFIYGEACGAIVIERPRTAEDRGVLPYARVAGWGVTMDGNRNPNPTYEGELYAVRAALEHAGVAPDKVDYVNPHGTGSLIGDEIELQVIRDCGLAKASINATKSLVGHSLSAAGVVEIISTLLQMRESRLHPTLNLDQPIDKNFHWIKQEAIEQPIRYALKLSMGFGGINTAVCLENL